MPKIVWDEIGARIYENGVDRGVLYTPKTTGTGNIGVPWNGLTGVTESPSGAEATPLYADNFNYANITSAEKFAATIEAYTYPKQFEKCDGSAELAPGITIGQQKRSSFGLSYRTVVNNDVDGDEYGYKIHLVYGAMAAPSEKGHTSINDSPDAITFSWALTTTPVLVPGFKPTASLTIDSTTVSEATLAAIELLLYGGTEVGAEATLPSPTDIIAIIATPEG